MWGGATWHPEGPTGLWGGGKVRATAFLSGGPSLLSAKVTVLSRGVGRTPWVVPGHTLGVTTGCSQGDREGTPLALKGCEWGKEAARP